MELKEILSKRRSVRRFLPQPVPPQVAERLLAAALTAPSSRNSRSTRLMVIDRAETIARMAEMRDYGAAFLKGAPFVILVMGDRTASDLWQVNASITATVLQLACVDEGLASCWVHVDGRPRHKDRPTDQSAEEYLRTFLPLPEECGVLCAIAAGYSDFTPAPLPEYDGTPQVIRL